MEGTGGCSLSPFTFLLPTNISSDMALFLVIFGFFRQVVPSHPVLVGLGGGLRGDSDTAVPVEMKKPLLLSEFESLNREPDCNHLV